MPPSACKKDVLGEGVVGGGKVFLNFENLVGQDYAVGILLTVDVLIFQRGFFFFLNDPPTTEIYPLSLHDALPINDTATTEIYTLSLHDALPISVVAVS